MHAAGTQQPHIPHVIAVTHAPGEHVGHGLEAAMRMIGEARDVVGPPIGAELVEQQEGVEVRQGRLAHDAVEPHPGAVACRHAAHDFDDLAICHGDLHPPI